MTIEHLIEWNFWKHQLTLEYLDREIMRRSLLELIYFLQSKRSESHFQAYLIEISRFRRRLEFDSSRVTLSQRKQHSMTSKPLKNFSSQMSDLDLNVVLAEKHCNQGIGSALLKKILTKTLKSVKSFCLYTIRALPSPELQSTRQKFLSSLVSSNSLTVQYLLEDFNSSLEFHENQEIQTKIYASRQIARILKFSLRRMLFRFFL
jgi:hypothetical protein